MSLVFHIVRKGERSAEKIFEVLDNYASSLVITSPDTTRWRLYGAPQLLREWVPEIVERLDETGIEYRIFPSVRITENLEESRPALFEIDEEFKKKYDEGKKRYGINT